ncbi:hypothetical protein ACFQBQ_03905 [Granulicella cerasi]|uniref:Uncharacterized protein n=1 Tax=Granulicella cerasi TaxID=741063 RepID=A0ABW1Z6H8_9BACT|nr:hypothetical protein [Granulicella cerasi]
MSEIDAEISRLQEARAALVAIGSTGTVAGTATRRRGRPKGSTNGAKAAAPSAPRRKRNLSPEGRKRIQEAMKRRWDAHRDGKGKSAKATR